MIIFKIFTRCVAGVPAGACLLPVQSRARTSVFRPGPHAIAMAKAMTGSFYLTETVQIPAATASGGRIQGSIDLG